MRSGTDMVVVDSRPFDEFQRVSIPTATNVPGAELVLRIRDIAQKPETLVVVNCAGRTRSIIGAQSLINAGLPNKVVALRNGTMGYTLAGFAPDNGKTNRYGELSADALAWAQASADRVGKKFGVMQINREALESFRAEVTRTLYVFDVPDPPGGCGGVGEDPDERPAGADVGGRHPGQHCGARIQGAGEISARRQRRLDECRPAAVDRRANGRRATRLLAEALRTHRRHQ